MAVLVETGRPADMATRLQKEQACYDLLDKLHLPYLRADHTPRDTIEQCAEVEQALGASICKNLFLCNRQQTAFYLLLLAGEKPFRTKDLSKQIGSARLSFAGAEPIQALLDLTPGTVSVMGLMNDRENRVQLLIDRSVQEKEDFCCHPCINTSTLKLKTADLLGVFLPAVNHTPIYVELPEDEV